MNRPFSSVIAIFPEGMPSCPPLRLNWGQIPLRLSLWGKRQMPQSVKFRVKEIRNHRPQRSRYVREGDSRTP